MVINLDSPLILKDDNRPPVSQLLEFLLATEKNHKKTKENLTFEALVGTWRLYLITGTQKAKKRAGIVLGKGRYLPSWLKITISYQRNESLEPGEFISGTVSNQIFLGPVKLFVSGPVKFFPKTRLLAFDFTRLNLTLFNRSLYSGFIRNGQVSEANFYQESIKKQAFFAYFLITETMIAARGRGGGLALWVKEVSETKLAEK
ncbi:hypothetical protein PN437_10925 [Microcystis aeruginosa CS-564/01]|uniref:hypothetical protein n=1 Tax=Microcystis aeruginosa TaxID=1126 RepID=UPI00232DA1E9|nr:hypothetical protein [Microcystis aeruginosa]MDB9425402.1 hypothetical protein [Microcystis aeruginosa CS-564/01]